MKNNNQAAFTQASKARPQAFCRFSRHAFDRLSDRSRLFYDEVADILDQGLVINTGCKPGFNRAHLVFYSPHDQCCFVAIQDLLCGTVVTILPLDYHANLAWPISEAIQQQAKEKHQQAPDRITPKTPVKVFLVMAHYVDENGAYKTIRIGKYPAEAYSHDFALFQKKAPWLDDLTESVTQKNIPFGNITELSLREGNDGTPLFVAVTQKNTLQSKKRA